MNSKKAKLIRKYASSLGLGELAVRNLKKIDGNLSKTERTRMILDLKRRVNLLG